MAVLQQRSHEIHFLDYRGVRIAIWVIIGLFALSVVRSGVTVWLLSQRRDEIANELALAESRAQAREGDLKTLETPSGVEKALRSAFNIKKPEERTIVILDPTPKAAPPDRGVRAWWNTLKQWFTQTP